MVEGCLLKAHALVGEREHECHNRIEVIFGEPKRVHVRREIRDVRLVEVAAAVVELHHMAERRLATVVHVGASELNVAQRRRLERAVDRRVRVRRHMRWIRHLRQRPSALLPACP